MERIFWVACPECQKEFYCDYGLRFADVNLICPFCQHEFPTSESSSIDERTL